MPCLRTLAAVAIAACLSANAVCQTTFHVPGDSATIQGAINLAQNGDTVLVSPGTYTENINFNGKAITVTSSNGAAVTTIDGGGVKQVVTFSTNEGRGSVLSGFTIQHGYTPLNGGGIYVYQASPKILNNIIQANSSIDGAGIEVYLGGPEIRGNAISSNYQAGGTGGNGGGGIELIAATSGTLVTGNTITGNTLTGGGNGGGIYVSGGGPITISNNTITGNSVYNHGGGLAVFGPSSLTIVQNLIAKNSSGAGGAAGGIFLDGPSGTAASVLNNTFYGNTGSNTGYGFASGIYTSSYIATIILNNIIVAAPGQPAVTCGNGTQPTLSHNDVYAPGGIAWAGCTAVDGTNFSADPTFVNASGLDLHLLPLSPAIDAGDNTASGLPSTDFDGNARIFDGNFDTVPVVDLGAYEFTTTGVNMYPANLAFPATLVTTFATPKPLTVYNSTASPVNITSTNAAAPFGISSPCTSIAAHSSCTMSVSYQPNVAGTQTGTVTVQTSNSATPMSTSVSGTGLDFVVSFPQPSGSIVRGGFGNFQVSVTGLSGFAGGVTLQAFTPPGITVTLSQTSVSTPGTTTMTLNVSGAAALGPANITISGTANGSTLTRSAAFSLTVLGGPLVSLSPSYLSFGNVAVGGSSAAQSSIVTNIGVAPLNLSAIVANGAFGQSNNCPSSLGVGASCTINVMFQPQTLESLYGAVSLVDNAGNSPQVISLTGVGANGVTFSPSYLYFMSTAVSQSSAPVAVSVKNSTNSTFTFGGISISGNFSQTNNCGASLAPGASCTMQVTFSPGTPVAIRGALTVTDAGGIPWVLSLGGNGVLPLTFSPNSVVFAPTLINTSASISIAATNNGNQPINISSIATTGAFSQTNTCPSQLAAHTSCSLSLTVNTPLTGSFSGALTVVDDAYGSPHVLGLSGTGMLPVAFTPLSTTFGSQTVGTVSAARTVTIINYSGRTLAMALSTSGDFNYFTTCTGSLAANASCTVSISFAPTAPGTIYGVLTVVTDAGTQTYNLIGWGT